MHTLVLTCAGSSTRYKGYGPKWSLTHPSGNLMACESIKGLTGYDNLYIVINEEQAVEFPVEDIKQEFHHAGYEPEIIIISKTSSQVETVKEFLKRVLITSYFTIKDCDNYFNHDLKDAPSVAVSKIKKNVEASNKSYVSNIGKINSIVEKEVISNFFCVGAYTFESGGQFLKGCDGAEYVSQVISNLLTTDSFESLLVDDYVDWGTSKEWKSFKESYATIFCDIDGVLSYNSHRTFGIGWGGKETIQENVKLLNELYDSKRFYIVLTTSRGKSFYSSTKKQLKDLKYDYLLMGLPACQRVLINDFVPSRSSKTAHSINLERDSKELRELFFEAIGDYDGLFSRD